MHGADTRVAGSRRSHRTGRGSTDILPFHHRRRCVYAAGRIGSGGSQSVWLAATDGRAFECGRTGDYGCTAPDVVVRRGPWDAHTSSGTAAHIDTSHGRQRMSWKSLEATNWGRSERAACMAARPE